MESEPEELSVARRAASIGGAILQRSFRDGFEMQTGTGKERWNLVTEADVASERAIVAAIHEAYPEHAILGEEEHAAEADAEHLWVIDPLDGTNNFAHGIPHFAVSIAYRRAGVTECGVVFNPARDDWFTTARGQGAYAGDERVSVAENRSLNEVFVGVGFYYDRGAMMEATLAAIGDLFRREIHGIRRFGTAALDLCFVGTGGFGAFFEYELSPWDFAAGHLFVEEAGGRVTTCLGDPLPLAKSSVLASNGHLHDDVREIVEEQSPFRDEPRSNH